MRLPLLAVLFALACNPTAEATSETAATSSTTTTPGTTGTDSSGEPTPTEGGTTGAPAIACDPDPEPLPEDQFVEIIADNICAQKAACGCAVDFACATPFAAELNALREFGQAHGLEYDGVCAAIVNNALVQHPGCELASAYAENYCTPSFCPIYRPSSALGDACEFAEAYATNTLAFMCESPLFCDDNVCTKRPDRPTVADGQPCFDPNNGGVLASCMPGSGCDFGGTRACQPLLGEGDPCPGTALCDYSLFCSADQICTARLPGGAACTDLFECAVPHCVDGKCVDDTWICGVAELADLFFSSPEIT